jgi:adenine-specific DNA-methyltransferase
MSTPKIINKIDAGDPETLTANIVQDNVEQLKSLFPEAVTEGKIDFEVLKQLLGGTVDDREEKYGLNWHGKRKARQLALTPSTGTLRPCPEDSVDWDTTQNLMIEGDNLEVLKLLQKSYAGKVKLIYIDPPYNTGKDFVYPDNFQDNIKNYLELTGQTGEGGKKLSSNTEASGRFHTDWLNMMYPRLKLARNLLREDGVIFISIDDNEVTNLKTICCDVFGEENFVACLPTVMNLKGNNDEFGFSGTHELTLVFIKDKNAVDDLGGIQLTSDDEKEYTEVDSAGLYKKGATLMRTGEAGARDKRPKGFYPIYVSSDLTRMSLKRQATSDIEVYPQTRDGRDMSWRRSPETLASSLGDFIITGSTDSVSFYRKQRLEEDRVRGKKAKTLFYKASYSSGNGTDLIKQLFGERVFNNPKPLDLIQDIVMVGCPDEGLVLDFFAGSGSTAHAVMARNAIDKGVRPYILVQLPEPLAPENKDQKISADYCDKLKKPRNIAELTKERLRRAGKKIKDENPLFAGDLGFRVFKLASSNIQAWEPDRDKLAETLEASIEHLKTDRTEQDILFELLLKLGLDLCVPIEKRKFAGKEVHAIGGGVLFACLAEKISRTDVEALAQGIVAWNKEFLLAVGYTAEASKSTDAKKKKKDDKPETTCVFRDSGFVDDVAKTNLAAILQQHGLLNVRSL